MNSLGNQNINKTSMFLLFLSLKLFKRAAKQAGVEGCEEMVIPRQLYQTVGPLTFHSEEM